MGLTLRYSDSENIIRSTGDPPNGVLAVGSKFTQEEGLELWLGVDSHHQPPIKPLEGSDEPARAEFKGGMSDREFEETFEAISVEDAVQGCDELQTALGLWTTVVTAVSPLVLRFAYVVDTRPFHQIAEFTDEVYEAVRDRFREEA
jgi:hypothetical protein